MTTEPRSTAPIRAPIALPPNRVSRPYRGGALLNAFRDGGLAALATPPKDGGDGDRPEDWLASTIRAWSPVGKTLTDEGLTVITDGAREITLRELVQRRHPAEIGGRDLMRVAGPTTGLLVRLVDAGERSPVHCHPDRVFAERFMGSRFGGTKAWLMLGTRQVAGAPPPEILLGFRDGVGRTELHRCIGDQDRDALQDRLHRRAVSQGDTWFIPAGIPHALGAGVFALEISEPTDFSLVAETSGFPVAERDAHLGMGWDVMVDAFDRRGWADHEIDSLRHQPADVEGDPPLRRERLLSTTAEAYVRAERLTLADGSAPLPWPDTFTVGVVLDGAGAVTAPAGSLDVDAGDAFAVPAAPSSSTSLDAEGSLSVIFCLPPEPQAIAATGWREDVRAG